MHSYACTLYRFLLYFKVTIVIHNLDHVLVPHKNHNYHHQTNLLSTDMSKRDQLYYCLFIVLSIAKNISNFILHQTTNVIKHK